MTDIVRVWGTCDKIQVEFKYEGGKQWSCTVPPDLKDGIYVAEFWAQDEQGRIGHWTGFLYMSSGVCHFKFNEEKYQVWFKQPTYKIEFIEAFEEKITKQIRAINSNTSELGKAILGRMILGGFFRRFYQFAFYKKNYEFEFFDSKYEITFKKGCEHWEP